MNSRNDRVSHAAAEARRAGRQSQTASSDFRDHSRSKPMIDVAFISADRFSMADLAAVWRAAYVGYSVPLPFDAEQLARHVLWTGIDLSLSIVGLADGEPFGLSLAARDGDAAWIGGFGVGLPHRRKGLGSQLIAAQAQRLDGAGVAHTRLECVDVNPAREVYRRAGFETVRDLLVFDCEAADYGEPGVDLGSHRTCSVPRTHDCIASRRRGVARFRNLSASCQDKPVVAIGRPAWREKGFAPSRRCSTCPTGSRCSMRRPRTEAAARSLLSAFAAVRPGVALSRGGRTGVDAAGARPGRARFSTTPAPGRDDEVRLEPRTTRTTRTRFRA